jgi:tripartite ATP-independent transporter DctM subunit
MASTAVLGSMLTPEMEKRGYKKPMSLGPILGSGGLAMMIPPSGLAVFAAVIAEASIGKILMGIIIPGLMMASLYAAYTILRCRFQPSIAPAYDITPPPLKIKLLDTARYILPVSIIIFLVIGVILLGIATPSEAAATGAVGCFLLAATYGKLTWKAMKSSLISTTQIATMVLIVAVGAIIYSQMLTFTGLGREVAAWITSLDVQPIIVIIFIQVLGVMIGMFMIALAVLTIILPVFLPIIAGLGFDPIWFVVIMLLNTEMAQTSPPYGSGLIIMRGVAPRDTTMGHIYKAALPYLGCDVIVLAIMIAFPKVVLWLPSLTR